VRAIATLRRSFQKNWPEVRAAARRELPGFVTAREPQPLEDTVPVFCYHVVDRETFEADLAFLQRNGYVPIGADRLVAHLQRTQRAPQDAVVLTFDDGPMNLYEVAYPCLQRFGMVAVAFVAGAFHETGVDEQTNNQGRPASWDELRAMQQSGRVDVQAHTYQHRFVPRWPEPRPLTGVNPAWVEPRREPALSLAGDLTLSRHVLEAKLDKRVQHLAFPDYMGTPDAVRQARRLGFASCWWGLVPGRATNRPGRSPYRIVRLSGEFVRRLPGEGRRPLRAMLADRYARRVRQITARRG
jgi:peptidoglycan/xylan/chitin deacetylase (PgdA/CDA1 family)